MALITRISRLFHADMNAVLDQIEEPELLLKQAIREMDETLIQNKRQFKLQEYDQQQLIHKADELEQSLNELEQQLEICFKSEKDDLAHLLIKRKLETKQYIKALAGKIANSEEKTSQLKTQLKKHQTQLDSLKQKAQLFNQENTVNADSSGWDMPSFSVQDEDVEIAFLHEKQKWSQL
jgi:phage shock protein A